MATTEPPPASRYIPCPSCGTTNAPDRQTCYECSGSMAAEAGTTVPVQCRNCGRVARVAVKAHARAMAGETQVKCVGCEGWLPIGSGEGTSGALALRSASAGDTPSPATLHTLGRWLVALGAVGMLVAFSMDTTVSSEYGGAAVHNLGLLGRQVVFAILGGMSLVAGAVFLAAGYLAQIRNTLTAPRLGGSPPAVISGLAED